MRHPQAYFRRRAIGAGHHLMPVVRMALRDRCSHVRALGAFSRVAPLHLLMDLVDDPETRPRSALAHNRSTPLSALVRLLDDPDDEIRYITARHPSLPRSILAELAVDPDWRMADGVINYPSATFEVLDLVASRPDDDPKTAAWLAKQVTDCRAARVSST